MSPDISDALFDFVWALRLDRHNLEDNADSSAALALLPATAGLPLNAVAAWPSAAQAGLLQLLEIWIHVDAIVREMG